MCGIFGCIGKEKIDICKCIAHFNKIKHRGPDNSHTLIINNIFLGFHRLCINGLNDDSNQPISYKNKYYLICNGEIFNYKELITNYDLEVKGNSDCEVLLPLYEKFGIINMINKLDGEFAFILYDLELKIVYVGRDHLGIRPLFFTRNTLGDYIFASEAKALTDFSNNEVRQFLPGCYGSSVDNFSEIQYYSFKSVSLIDKVSSNYELNRENVLIKLKELLVNSVKKRIETSDRPVGCFLSGGLDSSIVTSIASRYINNIHVFSIGMKGSMDILAAKKVVSFLNGQIETKIKNEHYTLYKDDLDIYDKNKDYLDINNNKNKDDLDIYNNKNKDDLDIYNKTINVNLSDPKVLKENHKISFREKLDNLDKLKSKKSRDIQRNIQHNIILNEIINKSKINHHIVNFTVDEGINALPLVIKSLESYDITTIRASVGQWLLSKYIKENTDIRVVLSGECIDECGGYYLFKFCKDNNEFMKVAKKMLEELYQYDLLRGDRTTAEFGLELRVPFAEKDFLQFINTINPEFRKFNNQIIEKKIVRDAFNDETYLPNDILYRKKMSFSDAIDSYDKECNNVKCFYKEVEKYAKSIINKEEYDKREILYPHNTPYTYESFFYRKIFEEYYPGRSNLIKHYWQPQSYITEQKITNEPSARSLSGNVVDIIK
jgi:asparagine synthetase B (glutamine-hydrolysing)